MWWKIYFWFLSVLLIFACIDMFSNPIKHLYMAIFDTAIMALLIIGLFSYVYKKIIFSPKLWNYVFWILIITTIISEYYTWFPNSEISPYLSYLISVEPIRSNTIETIIAYVFVTPFILPLYYVVFMLSKGKLGKGAKKLKIDTRKLKAKAKSYKKVSIKTVHVSTLKNVNKLKKVSKLKIALSVFGVIILSAITFYGFIIYQAMTQLPHVERVVNNYLFDMTNEYHSSAYGLFSDEYKKHEDFASFEKKVVSFNEGFKEIELNSLESESINVWHYVGQPPTINYSGSFTYLDGERAAVYATFIHVNGNWELYGVEIVAPPSRWDKYNQTIESDRLTEN